MLTSKHYTDFQFNEFMSKLKSHIRRISVTIALDFNFILMLNLRIFAKSGEFSYKQKPGHGFRNVRSLE